MIKKIFFLCLFVSPIVSMQKKMQRYFIIHDYVGLQKDADAADVKTPVSPEPTEDLDAGWISYHQPKKFDGDTIQVNKSKLIAVLTDIKE